MLIPRETNDNLVARNFPNIQRELIVASECTIPAANKPINFKLLNTIPNFASLKASPYNYTAALCTKYTKELVCRKVNPEIFIYNIFYRKRKSTGNHKAELSFTTVTTMKYTGSHHIPALINCEVKTLHHSLSSTICEESVPLCTIEFDTVLIHSSMVIRTIN